MTLTKLSYACKICFDRKFQNPILSGASVVFDSPNQVASYYTVDLSVWAFISGRLESKEVSFSVVLTSDVRMAVRLLLLITED
jgi:hypothetical protein